MNCPKCNMTNQKDAAYCAFCYERFHGRSAADTYLQAMKRVRAQENKGGVLADIAPEPLKPVKPIKKRRDWRPLFKSLKQFWKPLALLTLGVAVIVLVVDSLNPVIRFHYFGVRLAYAFLPEKPVTYIFGSITDAARWSERARQMDTPLGDLKIEDIATMKVQGLPDGSTKGMAVTVSSNNWLLNIHRKKGLESHVLSPETGLIPPGHFWANRRGTTIRHEPGSSIRIGKGMAFLSPALPTQRLYEGTTWLDKESWTDALDGWTMHWSIQRQWRVENTMQCGEDFCVQLHYDAVLIPHVVDEPAWISGARWTLTAVHGQGDVIFDATQHNVASHHMEYAAILRASVPDIGRIPKTMRVGRRAFHSPGEIIFDLKNSTSLQRN